MANGERRLAAIMFTDMVGYTRLSQANESLALELLEEHRSLLRPNFLAHGGAEVKTIGDAFLVEFKSALDAVICAVEMQRRIAERNSLVPPSHKLELRIGIHVGDVVRGAGDIYGDAVNVASRLEPLAEPGGICVSQQVFDQIRNKTSLAIEKVGDLRLKNVDLPVGVYKIGPTPTRTSTDDERRPSRERLAVLPFVNISPDPNDEYFADGLTEELIAKLSEIKDLKVIARTSVMSYKRKEKKVSEIAEELGVGSVIEGSVRKAANRIRISVQLIEPLTEEHLWSANYDNNLDDIFAIQTDVASKVAKALSSGFFSRAPSRDTDDIEAYTLYLRAMQLSHDFNESNFKEAITLLQRAVSKDPKFARAYAALANFLHAQALSGSEDFTTAGNKAEAAARKAVELDPRLAEGYAALAGVHNLLDRFDDALAEVETAVRINPNLAEAYMAMGTLDGLIRSPEDALQSFQRAYELDPLSQGVGQMVAQVAGWTGNDALAREILDRLREFNPKNGKIYLFTSDYYMEKGDFEQAQKMIDAARAVSPDDPTVTVQQALLFARAGKRKEAEASLNEVISNPNEAFRLNAMLWVHAALGDLDEAFDVLMRQAQTHSWPGLIKIDPLYAQMRSDARFRDFCRKVGIPP